MVYSMEIWGTERTVKLLSRKPYAMKVARTDSTGGMERRACRDRVLSLPTKWADDGSLWRAFIASVRHLAAEKHLDPRVLHGDGTNTVAKKGAMA
jgi:hypothetical protein